jgi:hypothetical protein
MLGLLLFNNSTELRIQLALHAMHYYDVRNAICTIVGAEIESINQYLRSFDIEFQEHMMSFDHNVGEPTKDFARGLFEQFGDVTDSIVERFKNILGTIPEFKHKVSFDFGSMFGTEFLAPFLSKMGAAKDALIEWLATPAGQFVIDFVVYCGLIFVLKRYTAMTSMQVNMVIIGVSFLLPPPNKMLGWACDFSWRDLLGAYSELVPEVGAEDEVHEQAGEFSGSAPMKLILSAIFGVLMGEGWVANQSGVKLVDVFMRQSSQFKKLKESIDVTFDFLFSLIAGFLDFIGTKFDIPYLKGCGVKFPEIDEIQTKLCVIVKELREGKRIHDYPTSVELTSMEQRLRTMLVTVVGKTKEYEVYRREIHVLLMEIKTLLERNKSCGVNGGPRVEPLSIMFLGHPGQAKSMGSDLFIYETIPKVLPRQRLDAYERSKDNEIFVAHADQGDYWDGYTGQFAVKFDDVLQLKDAAGAPNTMALTVIHSHNTSSWYPNFSAIPDKHSVPFTSRILVGTDNNLHIDKVINSLNCPKAFARRWDFCWMVIPKVKYCKPGSDFLKDHDGSDRKLDINWLLKLEAGKVEEKVVKDIWEFVEWDWGRGRRVPGGSVVDYATMQKLFIERFNVKQEKGLAWLEFLNTMAEGAISSRREELTAEEKAAIEKEALKEQAGLFEMDPFDILGITPEATEREIVAAYRKLCLVNSPDKGGCPDSMIKLTAAFSLVMDPVSRYEYACYKDPTAKGEDVLRKMIELKRQYSTEPIDPEERIKCFKELCEVVELQKLPYKTNVLPSEDFILMMAERLHCNPAEVSMYFYIHRFDEFTPLGDYYLCIKDWLLDQYKNKLQKIQDVCGRVSRKVLDIVTNKKVMAACGAFIALGAAIWVWMKPKLDEQTGLAKPKDVKPKLKKGFKTFSFAVGDEALASQGGSLTKSAQDLFRKVQKNIVWLSVTEKSEPFGWWTFAKGKFATHVTHTKAKMDEKGLKEVWLVKSDRSWSQKIKVKDITLIRWKESLNEDDGYYYVPTLNVNFADITHFYMNKGSREDEIAHTTHFGHLMVPEMKLEEGQFNLKVWGRNEAMANSFSKHEYGTQRWKAVDAISYPMYTEAGMCGLPWIVTDPRSSRPFIAGYHCAGNSNTGVSLIIYAQVLHGMYDLAIAGDLSSLPDVEMVPDLEDQSGPILPENWKVIQEVPYERVNSRSTLRRTPLFEKWSICDKRPALLHTKYVEQMDDVLNEKPQVIDPWWNAREPYGNNKAVLNQKALNRIADEYAKHMLQSSSKGVPWEPRVLSYEEAAAGYPGIMKGVPRGTSAGYPWNKQSRKKYGYFGAEADYEFDMEEGSLHRELYDKIAEDIAMMKRGERPMWVYQQFLKDELRSLKKVTAGLTRLVMGSPLDKTMTASMYFKDFMRFMIDNRIFNGIALGINPCSVEWRILASYLLAVGNFMIDGDFKHFDADILYQIDEAWLRVVESYYSNSTEEDRLIRRIILHDTAHSRHLVTVDSKSYIAEIENICPSGDLLTGIKQSGCNIIIARYAVMDILMRRDGYLNGVDDYDEGVPFNFEELEWNRFIALGDDHIMSVCDEHAAVVNQKTFGASIGRMGFTYTDAKKTGELIDGHRPLSDVSFLKRGFTNIEYYLTEVFAPLDLDVILQMPYWMDSKAPVGTLEAIIDIVAKELAARPKDYAEWGPLIGRAALDTINYRCPYLPINNDVAEISTTWRRAIEAYRSTELEYSL